MRLGLLSCLILLSACPRSPRPLALPALDLATAAFTPIPSRPGCTTTPNLKPENTCKDEFTDDGMACVNCPRMQGCFDQVDYVYCVQGGCALDARCRVHLESAPLPDAQPVSRKNHAPH